ncbi:hypothetical protein GE09DRAFT_1142226 [Coniochaeta sp. 2T2.1]|nr:hypothetical protein GE09DRAFT_1142226 [Coniochaeta sp. 2T2.1]
MADGKPHKFGLPCWMGIQATDVERASKFYATVFNWTFKPATTEYPQDKLQMFEFRPDLELSGGIQKGPDPTGVMKPGPGGICIYWLVEDIDAITSVIEHAGGKILSDVQAEGKSGRYRLFGDTEGNVGGVYQFLGANT